MTIVFKKYAYGDLNPFKKPSSSVAKVDTYFSNPLSALQRMYDEIHSANLSIGTGPFLAYVLRVEENGGEPNSFAEIGEESMDPTERVQIKARIPEIHAPLPEPKTTNDHIIIDMHPTFTAINNNISRPEPGDLVWVDFQNKQDWTGPIYLTPVIAPPLAAAGKQINRDEASSALCVNGCLKTPPKKNAGISAKNLPLPGGILAPSSENNNALVFGDSQIYFNLGKTMENALRGAGWKVKRIGKSGSTVGAWLRPGCHKNQRLFGCIMEYLNRTRPALIFISLGGNNKPTNQGASNAETAGQELAALVKLIRENIGHSKTNIVISGCPPVIPGRSTGTSRQTGDAGQWSYRADVNQRMKAALQTVYGFNSSMLFYDPIEHVESLLPKYIRRASDSTGDGLHMDQKGAVEYVSNIILDLGGKARPVEPAKPKPAKPLAENKDLSQSANKDQTEEQKKEAKSNNDKELKKDKDARSAKDATSLSIEESSKKQEQLTKQLNELKKAKPQNTQEIERLTKEISDISKKIARLQKRAGCVPCKSYKHRPLKTALAAAVPPADSRANPAGPAHGLMVGSSSRKSKFFTSGDAKDLKNFDFICPKIADGTSFKKFQESAKFFSDVCNKHGRSLQSWGWVYATDYEKAHAEGQAHAKAALAIKTKAHWVNAEKHWAGVHGEPFYPDPVGRMSEYVRGFREIAGNIPLVYCSMTTYSQPLLKTRFNEMLTFFDMHGPMCYGSGNEKSKGGASTQNKKWKKGWDEARQAGIPFTPTLGTGRVERKDKIWGDPNSAVELYKTHPPDWIMWWSYTPGNIDALVKKVIPTLKDYGR